MLENDYQGTKFRIVHCKGAIDSFRKALESVPAGKKRESFKNAIILQIERLASGNRMSAANFPQEGDLPKKKGQHGTKKFRAMKKKPLRGYCWLSEKYKDTYFISHYVHKDYTKLSKKEINIVGNNWRRIEVNNDEC